MLCLLGNDNPVGLAFESNGAVLLAIGICIFSMCSLGNFKELIGICAMPDRARQITINTSRWMQRNFTRTRARAEHETRLRSRYPSGYQLSDDTVASLKRKSADMQSK